MNKQNRVPVGCAHGRFQPPHNGHLEYLLAAKARCEFLWVGITRYDAYDDVNCDLATHRASKASNPLTYFERVAMLTAMLKAEGLRLDEFGFVPFPVDRPPRLSQFVPTTVRCFTTIYDDWNRHKVKVLQEEGYDVEVLWERTQKAISGHSIRESIKRGTDDWYSLVPKEIISAIEEANLASRVH